MKTDFKDKKVTVVGLARSGAAAALLLKELGAEVYASDSGNSEDLDRIKLLLEKKGINVETGAHSREFIKEKDLVVASPGVAEDSPALRWAREDRIPVIGEIELGYLCCEAPIIAVTGTNGKSTTVSLIGNVLRAGGKDVVVCGNIGNPFCGEISKIKKSSVVVLEASSFQLESIRHFKPYVAVMLNLSQNHFDRHPDLGSYLNAKIKIFHNQSDDDWAVLNGDDPLVRGLGSKTKARVVFFSREAKERAYFRDPSIFISNGAKEDFVCEASELKIKGGHNVDNALACLCVASIFGIDCAKAAEALKVFKGLEHRFEHVATINNVDFINDSKGTTVLATVRAIDSCDKPVILIAGGHDKGSDFSEVKTSLSSKVKKLILIGEAKDKIKRHLGEIVVTLEADSMEDAVNKAYLNASAGDCVLLSPMCASFDMFRNFEERGKVFKDLVLGLSEKFKMGN